MRSGGNNFNYFPENKLTKFANFVQFIRMLMFCLEDWIKGGAGPRDLGYATGLGLKDHSFWSLTSEIASALALKMLVSNSFLVSMHFTFTLGNKL